MTIAMTIGTHNLSVVPIILAVIIIGVASISQCGAAGNHRTVMAHDMGKLPAHRPREGPAGDGDLRLDAGWTVHERYMSLRGTGPRPGTLTWPRSRYRRPECALLGM